MIMPKNLSKFSKKFALKESSRYRRTLAVQRKENKLILKKFWKVTTIFCLNRAIASFRSCLFEENMK